MMHQIFSARAVCLLILMAICGEMAWPGPALAADAGAAPVPIHTVSVRLRGPVAWVEVVRSLTAAPGGRPDASEAVLDLALPPRAALLSVEVKDRGGPDRWQPTQSGETAQARRTYADALLGRGLSAVRDAADEAATHRVRVVWGADTPRGPPVVRYRFSALLEPAADRLRLRFAPSTELTPIAATVTVDGAGPGDDLLIAGQRVTRGAGPGARLRGQAHARAGWELSYWPAFAAPTRDGRAAGLDAIGAVAALPDGSRAVAVTALARRHDQSAPPGTVVFLIDRSRSVGLAGLAAERDTARQLLDLLPPATRFEALFFDRSTRPLFGSFRLASREAIAALDSEFSPDRLANGTDLREGLRAAAALLRQDRSTGTARALLVVITDGALPEDQTGSPLALALGAVPGVALSVAVLVVRARDEEATDPAALAALHQLAAGRGGVVRDVAFNELAQAVTSASEDLQRGGDLFDLQVVAGDTRKPFVTRLAPGQLAAAFVRWPAAAPRGFTLQATAHGRTVTAPMRALPVDASWVRPLLPTATTSAPATGAPAGPTSLLHTPRLTALIEPIDLTAMALTAIAPGEAADQGRGSIDRAVVQNTLGLAFMPRARACYQNRPAATPAARDLAGRVRLAIDLSRGEVAAARIESSTLAAPAVETCLRESAFALDVPRATRADAAVTAVVNLVFRPRPPDKVRTAEDSFPISSDIDLALEDLRKFERQKPPESR